MLSGKSSKKNSKGEPEPDTESFDPDAEIVVEITHTYEPEKYPKYNIQNMDYDGDALDFLRRGVDFEARDAYRKKTLADERN